MRIRLRGPDGASTIILGAEATVCDLRAQISEKTGLSKFDIKYSYPPKPLHLDSEHTLLSALDTRLDGEQLTISAQDGVSNTDRGTGSTASANDGHISKAASVTTPSKRVLEHRAPSSPSFSGLPSSHKHETTKSDQNPGGLVNLQRKKMAIDAPELPLPDRQATLVMRVMPDDNSCLFRALGTAILPGDDLSMTELRSIVASAIQAQPDVYTKVILDNREPDDYCRWIQTQDAWGGAIELSILSKEFDIEICSVDVETLRIDRFNEGAPNRCILVYSGIHYDVIVESPSDYPFTKAQNPPEFDKRIWDSYDDEILVKAQELCKGLQKQHYFTNTGGMAIKCNDCGWVSYGEGQAATHAQQTGHYDMQEMAS